MLLLRSLCEVVITLLSHTKEEHTRQQSFRTIYEMRTTTIAIVLSSVSTALAAAATTPTPQQCYFPDGTESTHTPCNATQAAAKGGFSACCSDSSYCMDNGLCLEAGILTRMSCTDKTFTDKTCPQYCNTGQSTYTTSCAHLLTLAQTTWAPHTNSHLAQPRPSPVAYHPRTAA